MTNIDIKKLKTQVVLTQRCLGKNVLGNLLVKTYCVGTELGALALFEHIFVYNKRWVPSVLYSLNIFHLGPL